ncbi:hypothetical protein PFISCL1PPCAC_24694, partial [Pristionchus fissidentatus]
QLVCACLKGYIDVSSQYNKEAGQICTKCNNSNPVGTDYVMLFDESSSTGDNRPKMVDFLYRFLQFINIDHTDNRFNLFSNASSEFIISYMRSFNESVRTIIKKHSTR